MHNACATVITPGAYAIGDGGGDGLGEGGGGCGEGGSGLGGGFGGGGDGGGGGGGFGGCGGCGGGGGEQVPANTQAGMHTPETPGGTAARVTGT